MAVPDGVNLTDINDSVEASRSESYLYTATGRLQHATGAYGDISYAYDAAGNRIGESLVNAGVGTDTSISYEVASNRSVEATRSGTSVRSFSHDAAGNMVTDNRGGTAYNYRYNNRGRLDPLSIGTAVAADYVYDGLERLAVCTLRSVTPAVTAHYVYDLGGRLIAEATAGSMTVREYVWLDDMPLALVTNADTAVPNLLYVHADHLDRPMKMTDAAKNVTWDALYLPFGDVDVNFGSTTNNLRFPGQYFLLESGLNYNWQRNYDPTIGRYTQPDPLS